MVDRRIGWNLGVVLLALCTGWAGAHTDAALEKVKGPNGGQVRVAGAYHLELVVARGGDESSERALLVYVTDHDGKKIATSGGSGNATFLVGKTRFGVTLAPDGDNRLRASARYPSSPDLKASVAVTLPGRPVEQARFTPYDAKAR